MGDSEGEKSMDFVTNPVEESVIFLHSTRPETPESPYIDPPSIPLPPSPSPSHLQSSSLPHVLWSEPLLLTSTLKKERMQKLEDELEEARRDLEEKQLALDEFRNVVEDLQMQAHVRLANEEDNLFVLRD